MEEFCLNSWHFGIMSSLQQGLKDLLFLVSCVQDGEISQGWGVHNDATMFLDLDKSDAIFTKDSTYLDGGYQVKSIMDLNLHKKAEGPSRFSFKQQ
jgi:hypothetical protein